MINDVFVLSDRYTATGDVKSIPLKEMAQVEPLIRNVNIVI